MWVCPNCGEHNENHFQECWKCVSDTMHQEAPANPEASPQRVRSLGSVLFRVSIGFCVGMLLGVAVFHRNGISLAEAAVSGAVVGTFVGGAVGLFLWVLFPYEPRRRVERPDPLDHEV